MVCQPRQQERYPGDMVFVREALIDILEVTGIGWAVIGRQAHAEQYYLDIAVQRRGDDMIEVTVHLRERQSAQAVITAQFHDEDIRVMTFQEWEYAAASSGGGFTADAGINHAAGGALPLHAFFE